MQLVINESSLSPPILSQPAQIMMIMMHAFYLCHHFFSIFLLQLHPVPASAGVGVNISVFSCFGKKNKLATKVLHEPILESEKKNVSDQRLILIV